MSAPSKIPSLESYAASSETDLVDSLQLIADSVAQQQHIAARAISSHGLSWTMMLIPLATSYRLLHRDGSREDWTGMLTMWAGCIMAGLVAVRYMVSGYLDAAEKTGTWAWLHDGHDGDGAGGEVEDVILVTKFDKRVIGAVVLRASPSSSLSMASTAQLAMGELAMGARMDVSRPGKTATVRAWTVALRYRRNGVGASLLADAVRFCEERGWEGPVFDQRHAHSVRLLPGIFNGGFEEVEQCARSVLERVRGVTGHGRVLQRGLVNPDAYGNSSW